jgi:hypothetical protein
MRRAIRGGSFALVAALLLAAPAASAQAQMREFTGQIDTVDEKQMTVDSRMDDRAIFIRVDETAVEGRKSAWSELKRKDWVTVSWKFSDKPRKAYKIVVLPPREEAGDDL